MGRLTKWNESKELLVREEEWLLKANGIISKDEMYKIMRHLAEKLAQFEDLDEQGLLLRLPCKVGDVVYSVTRDFISEYTICSIEVYNEGFFFCWRCEKGIYVNLRGFTNYQIGIDVFLTKAEAEQKLKEMESDCVNVDIAN